MSLEKRDCCDSKCYVKDIREEQITFGWVTLNCNSEIIKKDFSVENKEILDKKDVASEVKVKRKMENVEVKKNNEDLMPEISKEKSNRGRKKATSSASVVIKNKKAILSLSDVSIKKNKTFYLEDRSIKILDNLASQTGLTTSQLVQIAIDLLEPNLKIQS